MHFCNKKRYRLNQNFGDQIDLKTPERGIPLMGHSAYFHKYREGGPTLHVYFGTFLTLPSLVKLNLNKLIC